MIFIFGQSFWLFCSWRGGYVFDLVKIIFKYTLFFCGFIFYSHAVSVALAKEGGGMKIKYFQKGRLNH